MRIPVLSLVLSLVLSVVLSCAVLSTPVLAVAQCSGGFTSLGDNCYAYIHKPESWADAQSMCRAMGAHLAEVYDNQDNQHVVSVAHNESSDSEHYVWLGASDLVREGRWFWDSRASVSEFTAWDVGEPDDYAGEDCMVLRVWAGKWGDGDCDDKKPFICQIEADSAGVIVG